jgi:hypothetical protein
MEITRIYTGSDGRSHFEDLDVPLEAGEYGRLSALIPAEGVRLRETPAEGVLDFHTAPRRQFVVTLSGEVEIECGDGARRRFGPGGIMLADDTTGQGHVTREVRGPRRSLFIPLPAALDVSAWRSAGRR